VTVEQPDNVIGRLHPGDEPADRPCQFLVFLDKWKEFVVDKSLALDGLEFLSSFDGKHFAELSRQMQRRVLETEVTLHVIQPGTPPAVMFNIFKRINTGGMPLSPQEIRHALLLGRSTRLLKELAESEDFKEATAFVMSVWRIRSVFLGSARFR